MIYPRQSVRSIRQMYKSHEKSRSHSVNHDQRSPRCSRTFSEHILSVCSEIVDRSRNRFRSKDCTGEEQNCSVAVSVRNSCGSTNESDLVPASFLVSRFSRLLSRLGGDRQRCRPTFIHTWTTVGRRLLPLLWSTTTWTFEVCYTHLSISCV